MPVLDHFHPPLSQARHCESFHADWTGNLAAQLNAILPAGYVAESAVHHGPRIEVDVATFDEGAADPVAPRGLSPALAYVPPCPDATLAIRFPDEFETLVRRVEAGGELVGAIELVSPGNNDRPAEREAFVAKCMSYLERGVGLVVVDLVTSRTARLHDRLVELTEARPGEAPRLPAGTDIWAAAYRPLRRDEREEAEIWLDGLALGDPLPELPLWIDPATAIPVDLETSYLDTCRRNRIDVDRLSASEGPEIGST